MIAVGGTEHNSVILINRKPAFEIFKTLSNHTKPLTACKFFEDSDKKKRIITLGRDKAIRDYDIKTGNVNKRYSQSSVPLVADLSGVMLAVGYEDGSVRQWHLHRQREEVAAKKLHQSSVSDVKFSRDGLKIISASSDDAVIIVDSKTMRQAQTIYVLDNSL